MKLRDVRDTIRFRAENLAFYRSARHSMRRNRSPKAYLIGSPFHENLGDHAQTLCTQEWVSDYFPDYEVAILDSRSGTGRNYELIRRISRTIRPDDLVLLHSGYHMTDIYPMEMELQLAAVRLLPDRDIVILPQTINFTNKDEERRVASAFDNHGKVTILCRDQESLGRAQDLFQNCRLLLYPDIVTRKIGASLSFNASKRSGIHLCLRRDEESVYVASGAAETLHARLSSVAPTELGDTNSDLAPIYIRRHLREVLSSTWRRFGNYRVTVTDRYHGVIFSLIAGTPVVVLGTTDHKLRSGVSWFPHSIFGDLVTYVESIDEAVAKASELHAAEHPAAPPRFFEENYYSQLAEQIRGRQ